MRYKIFYSLLICIFCNITLAYDKDVLNTYFTSCPDVSIGNCMGAKLTNNRIRYTDLSNVNLEHANLSNAESDHVNFVNANLVGANLTNANLAAANLHGANIYGANLTLTNIPDGEVNLSYVKSGKIVGVPRSLPSGWAIIQGYLVGKGANLTGANLSNANLANTNISDADLTNANLSSANLNGAILTGVIWNNTNCIDNTNSNNHIAGSCLNELKYQLSENVDNKIEDPAKEYISGANELSEDAKNNEESLIVYPKSESSVYKAINKETGKVVYSNSYPDADKYTHIEEVNEKLTNISNSTPVINLNAYPNSTNCAKILASCPTINGICVSIGVPSEIGTCDEKCKANIIKKLKNVGVSAIAHPGAPRTPTGCVGYRKDAGGTEEGAICLSKILGFGYNRFDCDGDGFAYNVRTN